MTEICGWLIKGRKGNPDYTCVLPTGTHQRHRGQAYVDFQHSRDNSEYRSRPDIVTRRRQYDKDRWRNSEEYREVRRQRKRSDPYKETRKQYRKRPEVVARETAYNKEYYSREETRARVRAQAKEYYQKNPEPYKFHASKRRARLLRAPREDWTREQVIALYGDCCYLCEGPYEHTDHVIPISRGGWDMLPNLRPACAACNLSKHDHLPPLLDILIVLYATKVYVSLRYDTLLAGLARSDA